MSDVHYEPETKVRANGIDIAYDSFGDPAAPPLILIMGFTMQMVAWDEVFCQRLAERGFRVIRFDNRDIGHSSWLSDAGIPDIARLGLALFQGTPLDVPYRLLDMAGDVVGLMDALSICSAHIVGMSMGGMIAQTLAIHHPERIRTLTSYGSTAWSLNPDLPHPTREASAVLMQPIPMDRDGFIAGFVRAWQVIGGSQMPVDEAILRERARQFFERGISLPGLARQMAAIMASGSRREALRNLRIPSLVIHGDADPLIPLAHGIDTAQTIPGAKLHIVKGMGHEIPPVAWPEIIDILTEHASQHEA